MSDKKKPLPRPPRRNFGPKKGPSSPEGEESLSADKMAEACTQGRLNEYISEEFGGNEQAERLARMMMGMSGMTPPDSASGKGKAKGSPSSKDADVPEDVRQASLSGDLGQLMGLLKREHEKRSAGTGGTKAEKKHSASIPKGSKVSQDGQALLDRDTLDRLIEIAAANSVSIDWVIARAIKLYVRDYKLTGRV